MFSSDTTHQAERNTFAGDERYRLIIFYAVFLAIVIALLFASTKPGPGESARSDQALMAEISSLSTSGCAQANEFILLQSASHPPHGRELVFKTRPKYLPGSSPEQAEDCSHNSFRQVSSTQLTIEALPVERSNMLIAFRPKNAEFARRAIPALQDLVQSLAPHERAAIYLWGSQLRQLIDFTSDKQQLAAAIARLSNSRPTEQPMTPQQLVHEAQQILNHIADGDIFHEQILGVLSQPRGTTESTPEDNLESVRAETIWTGEIPPEPGNSHQQASPWPDHGSSTSLANLVPMIKERTRRNHFRAGYCSQMPAVVGASNISAESMQEASRCNATDIARGRLRGSRRVDLLLSPEAQFIYEARKSLADLRIIKAFKPAKRAFPVRLRLNGESNSIPAILNIRGAGTLSCKRKSFGVELAEGQRARLFPTGNVNRFNLLSLCKDATLIKTHLGASIFRDLGLFPLQFRNIEVMINGKSNGIYLATEHPFSSIFRSAQPVGLLRRGYDLEARGPLETGADAIRDFLQVANSFKNGTPAEQHIAEEQLGLDRYLLWLAVNSLLLNGDYVDELWLLATAGVGPDGTASTNFSAFAWDFDALFTECHQMGKAAVKDPYGLLYCAESDIAKTIAARPELYDRYVKVLEATTEALDNVAFEQFVERSLHSIEPFAGDRELVGVTYQLDQRSEDGQAPLSLYAELKSAAKSTVDEFSRRRREVIAGIELYRAKQARPE